MNTEVRNYFNNDDLEALEISMTFMVKATAVVDLAWQYVLTSTKHTKS